MFNPVEIGTAIGRQIVEGVQTDVQRGRNTLGHAADFALREETAKVLKDGLGLNYVDVNAKKVGNVNQDNDFDQKLTQEYQKARNTPGMEEYARQIEGVAKFRSQGMGGVMEGNQLANQAIGMEGQLRANQEYQMAQQQKAAEWATNKARDVQRDTSNQKFAQDVGLENLRQGYTQEQNIRQLKSDQAKDLLVNYVNQRQAGMNFAQNAFRSLV